MTVSACYYANVAIVFRNRSWQLVIVTILIRALFAQYVFGCVTMTKRARFANRS